MYVYLLKAQVHNTKNYNVIEYNDNFANVYLTLDEAIQQGITWFKYTIQEYYYGASYNHCNEEQYSNTSTEELQRMLDCMEMNYDFSVIEIDLEYANSFILPKHDYECRNLKPTEKNYKFDFKGQLLKVYWEYKSKLADNYYSFVRFPRR